MTSRAVGGLIFPDFISAMMLLICASYCGAGRPDLADPDTAVVDVLLQVARELAGHQVLDRREHARVDLLLGRRQHEGRREVALVGVDADHLGLRRHTRGDHAQPASAGDLEHDLRARVDLVERKLLARGLIREVLRVRVEQLGGRVRRLDPGLVAADVVGHRWDALTADRGRGRVAVFLQVEPGEVTGRVAGLLLGEVDSLDVLGRVRSGAAGVVDDRKVHIRVLRRNRLDCVSHQEPDRDHELVARRREPSEVRDVVGAGGRLEHRALDSELRLGLEQALVGQMVEAVIVEPADVGHQTDLETGTARRSAARRAGRTAGARRGRAARGATARSATAVAAPARGKPQSPRDDQSRQDRAPHPPRHLDLLSTETNGQP